MGNLQTVVMGGAQSDLNRRLSAKTIKDLSEKSNLSQDEIKAEEEAYVAKYPDGIPRNKLADLMQKALPKLSETEVLNITEHCFRVLDIDDDSKVSYKEIMIVWCIVAFTDVETVLGKLFDVFDINGDGKVSKSEMKTVVKDLSILSGSNTNHEKIFEDMDKDKDNMVDKDEFVKAIQNRNIYGQEIASKLAEIF